MADLLDRIIYEDNHLIVINKESGELVQGDKTGDTPLLDSIKSLIKERDQKPGAVYLGAPHRLDRPVSGVVVFAKTSKALSRMSDIFRRKAIQKTYWAIVKKKPKAERDTLTNFLKKDTKKNKSFVYRKEIEGSKKATLHYQVIQKLDNYTLLEIDLETGRHHQIRTQLSHIGSPIKGDLKYGFDRSNKDGSISLHARKINFIHPVTKETITLTAPTPKDPIWNACL